MRSLHNEVVVCVILGLLVLPIGELVYVGSKAAGLAVVGVGFFFGVVGLAFAAWRGAGTRLSRAAGAVTGTFGLLAVAAHAYLAAVVAGGGQPPTAPVMVIFLGMVAGIALLSLALARAKLAPALVAALTPVAFLAWPFMEEAAPAWGGVAGSLAFAVLASWQILAMRRVARRGASPAIAHEG